MSSKEPTSNVSLGSILAIIGAVLMVAIGAAVIVILAITGDLNTNSTSVMTIIALIVTAVPSLIAAGFAKQAATDIRNGVLTAKVAAGTHIALEESGVKDVVASTQKGESTVVVMQALSRLLEQNTTATLTNTNATQTNTDEVTNHG